MSAKKPVIRFQDIKDPAVRRAFEAMVMFARIGDGQTGDPKEAYVKVGDLGKTSVAQAISNGLDSVGGGGGSSGGGNGQPQPDLTPPSAPENVEVIGGFDAIYVSWSPTNDTRVGFAEVFRHTADDRTNATMVGATQAGLYRDGDVIPGQTYYYWVRYVNRWSTVDNWIVSPFNAIEGTAGAAALDPAALLDALSEQITESQLYQDLQDRINLIDAPGTGLVEGLAAEIINRANAIAAESDARTTQISAVTGLASAAQTSANAAIARLNDTGNGVSIEALAVAVDSLVASSGEDGTIAAAAFAKASTVETRLNNATGPSSGITMESVATDAVALKSTVEHGTTGLAATHAAVNAAKARLDDTGSGQTIEVLTSTVSTMGATINHGTTGLAAAHTRSATVETRLSNVGATGRTLEVLGTDFSSLRSQVLDPSTGLGALATAVNSTQTSVTELNGQVSAQATSIAQLSSSVGALGDDVDSNAIAIQQEITTRASQTGQLYGQYSVKIDANGHIAGFGLSSSVPNYNGQVHSQFIVSASTFGVGAPGSTTLSFVVDTVANRVVMNGAFIQNATITNAAIQSVAVEKITGNIANFIQGNFNVLQSTNFSSALQRGWRFNVNGTHEIYGGPGSLIVADKIQANAVEIIDTKDLKPNAVFIWEIFSQDASISFPQVTVPGDDIPLFECVVDFTEAYPDTPVRLQGTVMFGLRNPNGEAILHPGLWPASDPRAYRGARLRWNFYRNNVLLGGTDLVLAYGTGVLSSENSWGGYWQGISSNGDGSWVYPLNTMGMGFSNIGGGLPYLDYPGPGIHTYQLRAAAYAPLNPGARLYLDAGSWMMFDAGKR